MIRKVFFSAMLIFSPLSLSGGLECQGVYMAGTGEIAGKTRRFVTHSGSWCLYVQTLNIKDELKVMSEEELCRLEGKDIGTGYMDVSFNKGEFYEGKLYFEVSVTPLELTGEEIKLCEVVFENDRARRLKCESDKSMTDLRPALSIFDIEGDN